MFIKVADRELQPTTMMAGRLVLAAPILFVLLASREGVRPAVSRLRGSRASRRSRSGSSRRAALHADRLGREAHRLGRGRDRERVDADLRRADRDPVPARASGRRACGSSGSCVGLVGVGVLVGVAPERRLVAVRRHARGRRGVGLLRDRRASGASTSSRTTRRSCCAPPRCSAVASCSCRSGSPSCRRSFPSWKAIGCVVALGVARDGDRRSCSTSALLQHGRLLAREPGHLPACPSPRSSTGRCCSTSRSRPRSWSGSS